VGKIKRGNLGLIPKNSLGFSRLILSFLALGKTFSRMEEGRAVAWMFGLCWEFLLKLSIGELWMS